MGKDSKQNQIMENVGNIVDIVKKAAQDKAEAAKQAADQNGDGKFDLRDVKAFADDAKGKAADAVQDLKNAAINRLNERELKTLRPIFPEDLTAPSFSVTKLMRISERGKPYAEKEITKGSIGYLSEYKDVEVVNIFEDSVDVFGLSFYPNSDNGIYYVDPTDRNRYVASESYFGYLKNARIIELRQIAQDLGAKHFRVTYSEEYNNSSHHKSKVNSGEKQGASHEKETSNRINLKVVSEDHFEGGEPKIPHLRYLRSDQNVIGLVEMRLKKSNPFMHNSISIQFIDTCGIKKTDAAKIDTVLKGLKLDAGLSFESEVNNESMRYFEYEIDF